MKTVGQYEVTDRGIETITEVEDYGGTYTTRLYMPKETFIQAYIRYIKNMDIKQREEEIAKTILEMGYDRTNYPKDEVNSVICKALKLLISE